MEWIIESEHISTKEKARISWWIEEKNDASCSNCDEQHETSTVKEEKYADLFTCLNFIKCPLFDNIFRLFTSIFRMTIKEMTKKVYFRDK